MNHPSGQLQGTRREPMMRASTENGAAPLERPAPDHQEDPLMAARTYTKVAPGLRRIEYEGSRGTTVQYKSTVYRDGKSSSETRTFTSDREARKWHASRTVRKDEGSLTLDNTTTFEAHCRQYLTDLKALVAAGERKATTLANREKTIRNHLVPYFGRKKLRDIRPEHLRSFVVEKRAASLDAGTLWAHLSAILSDAVEKELIPINPCQKVAKAKRPSRQPKTEARVLTLGEAELLAHHARPGARDFFWFLGRTGCRVSEACGLVWSDITFGPDSVTVSIEKQLAIPRQGEEPKRVDLKTKNSKRTLTMGAEMRAMLWARKVSALAQGHASGDGFVFASKAGRPFDQRNVCEDIRQAGNRAGLNPEGVQPVSAHDLRHSLATRLYRKTRDISRVAAWIGDTEVTCLRIYVHQDKTQNDERLWAEAI